MHGIEEQANLIYAQLAIEQYRGDIDNISMKIIVDHLQDEGYKIKTFETSENTITGIIIDKESFTIKPNEREIINVTYQEDIDKNVYYAVVRGKYYKMIKNSTSIIVERIASEVKEDEGKNKLKAEIVSGDSITIGNIDGNVITVNGKDIIGTSVIKITYGNYFKECTISVLITPTDISVADKTTPIKTGYGRVDVIWLNTQNEVIQYPNPPILTSNNETMIPVKWKDNNEIVETTQTDSNWYKYVSGSERGDNLLSKWANAKTKNNSYFVWIPRYAYRIIYYENETSTQPTGYYDGWGMWSVKDGKVKYNLDSGIETVEYNGQKYIVHPAFETNLENGGWNTELSGFWFAKFGMSGETGRLLCSTYGVTSVVNQIIGSQYTNGREATYGYVGTKDFDDGKISYMNSHMIKRSEWGAVAYLTHSKYGRNGNEITINSTNYTGGGTGEAYITNTSQSTTGNIYGIYDMSGGTYDSTSAFNSVDQSGNYSTYGWTKATGLIANSNSTKYATKYNNTTTSYCGEIVYTVAKVGDAIKEVFNGDNSSWNGWFSDYNLIPNCSGTFSVCGGTMLNGDNSGIFSAGCYEGDANETIGFRTVLCP